MFTKLNLRETNKIRITVLCVRSAERFEHVTYFAAAYDTPHDPQRRSKHNRRGTEPTDWTDWIRCSVTPHDTAAYIDGTLD